MRCLPVVRHSFPTATFERAHGRSDAVQRDLVHEDEGEPILGALGEAVAREVDPHVGCRVAMLGRVGPRAHERTLLVVAPRERLEVDLRALGRELREGLDGVDEAPPVQVDDRLQVIGVPGSEVALPSAWACCGGCGRGAAVQGARLWKQEGVEAGAREGEHLLIGALRALSELLSDLIGRHRHWALGCHESAACEVIFGDLNGLRVRVACVQLGNVPEEGACARVGGRGRGSALGCRIGLRDRAA